MSTTAGVTASPSDARPTQTGSCLLVTTFWEGSFSITPACWVDEEKTQENQLTSKKKTLLTEYPDLLVLTFKTYEHYISQWVND